jgi:hypothetical protein
MPIIDTTVYSRNQVFRIVESRKFTDNPIKDAVLRFHPAREHCMTNLLSTLVCNVRGVTTWLSEHLCSYLTSTDMTSVYTVTEDWQLVCKHPRCTAIGADTRLLGRISSTLPARHVTKVPSHALRKLQTSQMFANRWNHWRTLTADSLLFNGAFNDLDTMQKLTEHAVALQQYSCSGRRTLAETYLLSPAEPHSSSAT